MKTSNSSQTILRHIKQKPHEFLLSSQKKPIFFIHILKNKQMIEDNIKSMQSRNELKKNKSQFLTVKVKSKHLEFKSRNPKKNALPKICPYSYRYFFKKKNKNLVHKSSFNVNSIETSKSNMESNFMQLCDESNIYTSNVKYISNKKMVLLDKFKFDNNIYKPDRLKIYDMSKLPPPKIKLKKINFRKVLYNKNVYKRDNNNNNKKNEDILDILSRI